MADVGFTIPTMDALIARIRNDLNARMGNSNALIKRSLPWVLSYILAGVCYGMYLYQKYVARQVIPDSAETIYLQRWCRIWGVTRVPAAKATGTVIATGIAGATLPTGAIWTRNDGTEYTTTGGPYIWVAPGQKDVTVEAVVAGDAGNLDYDATVRLTLASPPAGMTAQAPLGPGALPVGLAGGADTESDASFLERLLDRMQNPPQGGSEADYIVWAQAAHPTVDRVWVQNWPESGVAHGQVKVLFVVEGTGTAVLPVAGVVTTVNTYIGVRKPAEAELTVAAPSGHAVTLAGTVHLLPGYAIADVRQFILEELESMFREKAEVTATAGSLVKNSWIRDAIDDAEGVDWFTLTAVDGGGATADVTLGASEYPTQVIGGLAGLVAV